MSSFETRRVGITLMLEVGGRQRPDILVARKLGYLAHVVQKPATTWKMKTALRGDANTVRWLLYKGSQKFSPRRRPPSLERRTAKI